MSSKRVKTTVEIRKLIIKHWNEGKSLNCIAKIVDSKKSTVSSIINKFKKTGKLADLPRSGRPKKLNKRAERSLASTIKKNRFVSAKTLACKIENDLGVKISPKTVIRSLKRQGIVSRVPRKVPCISDKNCKLRLNYAKTYIDMPDSFWNKVLWTDESKFNVKRSDGRIRVWRSSKNCLENGTTVRTFKHGNGSVMVWGCMSAAGVGKLVFIEGNMDKHYYKRIIKENVEQSARNLGIGDDFVFLQDNDPKHKAKDVMEFMEKKGWDIQNHPPQSPDLNVIEHLWDEIDRRIDRTGVNTIEQLKVQIVKTWESIDPSITKKLVESMPRRLAAVVKAKGQNTRY